MTATDDSPVPDFGARLRLDDRRFVVIGAGQGIGRQATHALTQQGAKVMCVDVDQERADEIAEEVGGVGWAGDATSRGDVERLFADTTKELGGVDGVIDIVGMAQYKEFLDVDDENWQWHHDIVLRHAYLALNIGGRIMAENDGGVMVFVASVSGISSAPLHSAYGVFKAGLMSLVRTAAVELGPKGVRVNAVAPGMVWTPRVASYVPEEGKKKNELNTPLRRVALPEDIAAPLLFMASDLSSYVNGQTLVVDGGVSAKFPYPMEF
jgi:NAD(P)-dependent dehydrogenase (short-subunit alcohol dehydrogenase family)